jgi:hypothetical protein
MDVKDTTLQQQKYHWLPSETPTTEESRDRATDRLQTDGHLASMNFNETTRKV